MQHIDTPRNILEFITSYQVFAIIGHEEPDGDCLSSQIALAGFIQRLGKKARCYSAGPFVRPEVQQLAKEISVSALESPEAVIIVDCSTLDRVGHYKEEIPGFPTGVIDHHSSGIPFGDVRYIEPKAPSTTYLIQKVMEEAGEAPNQREAELLLFGLCTDTGFFRHLGGGSQEIFGAVSRLVAAGASPNSVFYRMFGNRTFGSRKLLGRLLDRTQPRYDGRLLVTWETGDDLSEFGKQQRDSESLYQLLQMVHGCDVIILVRQEDEASCSVGLRSTGNVDVGKIAQSFGGGGHHGAAGYERPGDVHDVVREIVDFFKPIVG